MSGRRPMTFMHPKFLNPFAELVRQTEILNFSSRDYSLGNKEMLCTMYQHTRHSKTMAANTRLESS